MKKLLTAIFFFPALLFAQQKKGADFIKKSLYLKLSPTLLVFTDTKSPLPENTWHPSFFGTIGVKPTRYTAVGFSAGYFKMKSAGSVTPVGIDLTITDFKAKRAFPVITGQWYHTAFNERYQIGGYSIGTYYINGKDMYHIGAGVAFRAIKITRIQITLGVARMRNKTTEYTANGGSQIVTVHQYNKYQYLTVLSAGLVF